MNTNIIRCKTDKKLDIHILSKSHSSQIYGNLKGKKHNFTVRLVIMLINLSFTNSEETTFVGSDMIRYEVYSLAIKDSYQICLF